MRQHCANGAPKVNDKIQGGGGEEGGALEHPHSNNIYKTVFVQPPSELGLEVQTRMSIPSMRFTGPGLGIETEKAPNTPLELELWSVHCFSFFQSAWEEHASGDVAGTARL